MKEQETLTQITSRSLQHSTLVAIGHFMKLRQQLPDPSVREILEIGPGIGVSLGRMRGMFPTAHLDALSFDWVDPDRRIVGVRNVAKDMRWSGFIAHDQKEVPMKLALEYLEKNGLLRDDLNLRDQYLGDFYGENEVWEKKRASYDLIYEQYGPIEKTRHMKDRKKGGNRFESGLLRVVSLLREGGAFLFTSGRKQHAAATAILPEADFYLRHIVSYKERHCSLVFRRP